MRNRNVGKELYSAIKDRNPKVALALLTDITTADINYAKDGKSCLYMAVKQNLPAVVEVLLNKGANYYANDLDKKSLSPILLAASDPELIDCLMAFIQHTEHLTFRRELWVAVSKQNIKAAEILLNTKVDPNYWGEFPEQESYKNNKIKYKDLGLAPLPPIVPRLPLLYMAAALKDTDMVALLVKNGAKLLKDEDQFAIDDYHILNTYFYLLILKPSVESMMTLKPRAWDLLYAIVSNHPCVTIAEKVLYSFALHQVILADDLEMVEVLLRAGTPLYTDEFVLSNLRNASERVFLKLIQYIKPDQRPFGRDPYAIEFTQLYLRPQLISKVLAVCPCTDVNRNAYVYLLAKSISNGNSKLACELIQLGLPTTYLRTPSQLENPFKPTEDAAQKNMWNVVKAIAYQHPENIENIVMHLQAALNCPNISCEMKVLCLAELIKLKAVDPEYLKTFVPYGSPVSLVCMQAITEAALGNVVATKKALSQLFNHYQPKHIPACLREKIIEVMINMPSSAVNPLDINIKSIFSVKELKKQLVDLVNNVEDETLKTRARVLCLSPWTCLGCMLYIRRNKHGKDACVRAGKLGKIAVQLEKDIAIGGLQLNLDDKTKELFRLTPSVESALGIFPQLFAEIFVKPSKEEQIEAEDKEILESIALSKEIGNIQQARYWATIYLQRHPNDVAAQAEWNKLMPVKEAAKQVVAAPAQVVPKQPPVAPIVSPIENRRFVPMLLPPSDLQAHSMFQPPEQDKQLGGALLPKARSILDSKAT